MANLIVRNIDDALAEPLLWRIANAFKVQASQHGISAEAEHRLILEQALLHPKKKPFLEALSQIPDVGTDADFARVQDLSTTNPID
jgi:antitoxin FitA